MHALGKIMVTEDVISLRYTLHALGDIPHGLYAVRTKLLAARAELFSEDEHVTNLFDHITDVLRHINHVLDRYGGSPSARTIRRGRR